MGTVQSQGPAMGNLGGTGEVSRLRMLLEAVRRAPSGPLLAYLRALSEPESALLAEDALLLIQEGETRWTEASQMVKGPGSPMGAAALALGDGEGELGLSSLTGAPERGSSIEEIEVSERDEEGAGIEEDEEEEVLNPEAEQEMQRMQQESGRDVTLERRIARLSGRREDVIPYLYGQLLFERRLIVLEHIRIVLVERKSRPGEDTFFTSTPSPITVNCGLEPSAVTQGKKKELDIDSFDRGLALSLSILNEFCRNAMTALREAGGDASNSVITALKDSVLGSFQEMKISSLHGDALDNTMDFLLEQYDERENLDALSTLCVIATGRGSVLQLLNVCLCMKAAPKLKDYLKPIALEILEKSYALAERERKELESRNPVQRDLKLRRKMVRLQWRLANTSDDTDLIAADVEQNVSRCEGDQLWNVEMDIVRDSIVTSVEKQVLLINDSVISDLMKENRLFSLELKGKRVTKMSSGPSHALALCESGEVFAIGSNSFGQCGSSSNTPELAEFELVDLLDIRVSDIAAGASHSLFLSEDGREVFACGDNSHGQLGVGHTGEVSVPSIVVLPHIDGKRITAIAAGRHHSVVVFGGNEIYGCGTIQGKDKAKMEMVFCSDEGKKVSHVASSNAGGFCVALEEAGAQRKKRILTCLVEDDTSEAMPRMWLDSRPYFTESFVSLAVAGDTVHLLVDELDDSIQVPDSPRSQLSKEFDGLRQYLGDGVDVFLWSLLKFPVWSRTAKFRVASTVLSLLQQLDTHRDVYCIVQALRVLQRHCFASAGPTQVEREDSAMTNLKKYLFALARGEDGEVKEEAIRAIGNGFAFLSPSAKELATFLSTITNMTYLSKFATFKFWSELLAQEQQGTAMILIERLIELASNDKSKAEVLNLLLAMQRSLILAENLEVGVVNRYISALARASAKILEAEKLTISNKIENSIVKTLAWPCVAMLHHPTIILDSQSSECLQELLLQVDRLMTMEALQLRHWFADLQWGLLLLLLDKACPKHAHGRGAFDAVNHARGIQPSQVDSDAASIKVNMGIFSSGFASSDVYEGRLRAFEDAVANVEHVVMESVSKMNKMKFRNKVGEHRVWGALRAVYAVIALFDTANEKADIGQTAMKILRWLHLTKQSLGESGDYAKLANGVISRARFLLEMNDVSEHSVMQFVQQDDDAQLKAYETELRRQILLFEQDLKAFILFESLLRSLKTVDALRHVMFVFVEFCRGAKVTEKTSALTRRCVDSILRHRNRVSDRNPILTTAILDLCISTGNLGTTRIIPWLVEMLQIDPLDNSDESEQEEQHVDVFDAQSLTEVPHQDRMPQTTGIQWSREHKHSLLRLSKDGLCFHLPQTLPEDSCHSAAVIRLSHLLHSGRFYFQFTCTPAPGCPASLLLYAVGLVPSTFRDWDSFSKLTCGTLCSEQEVGYFVDMDEGQCLLFKHDDEFYHHGDIAECRLPASSVIASQKYKRAKFGPMSPAVALMSPGTTSLLKHVLFENDSLRISVDPLALPSFSKAQSSFALTRQDFHDGVSAIEQRTDNGAPENNPEQNALEDDDVSASAVQLLFSGPLNEDMAEETDILVCGQNSYGELGLGDTKPHKNLSISTAVKGLFPVQVVAGNEITGVLTSQGEVYVWGYNKHGACGSPSEAEEDMVQDEEDVKGEKNSKIRRTPSSKVLSMSASGLLMAKDEKMRVMQPRLIPMPHFVTKLCCANGSEHLLAVTSTGHLFGWGFNQYGQLGLGHKYENVVQPSRVEGALRDKRVVYAATSYSHSLALTSDGMVYGFGLNTRGQLGIGSTADIWTLPQCSTHLAEIGRARSLACGVEHSIVVMGDGSLYSFGRNDCGQLGIDDASQSHSALPVQVGDGLSKLRSLHCEAVSCGYFFTVVIANGTLHAFGKNDFGQLGLGHNYEVFAPVPVLWNDPDDCFAAVTCGTGHSIAATTYGRIIAWGRNKDGGLGNGTFVDHPFPVEICNKGDTSLALRDQQPLHIAAGFHHSCILAGPRRKPQNSLLKQLRKEPMASFLDWKTCAELDCILVLRHALQDQNLLKADGAPMIAVDWVAQRIHPHASIILSRKIGPRTPSFETGNVESAWLHAKGNSSLYLNFLLRLLCDLARAHKDVSSEICEKRPWLIDLLLDVAFSSGTPIQSGLAFDVLGLVLIELPVQQMPRNYALRQLLLFIGESRSMEVASQVVSLIRTLLSSETNGWKHCINRALLYSLAAQIPRLPDDVEDLSLFDENSERFLTMIGALKVLGASDEVLYVGAPVRVVASEIDGKEGVLEWFRPGYGSSEIAQVTFPGGGSVVLSKQSEIVPRSRVSVPVDAILRPERLLALLVGLVQQSIDLNAQNANMPQVRAACVHEIAKSKASKVIDILLKDRPSMVQTFVSAGHLQAVTSLLAAPRGRLDNVPLRALQRRFSQLEKQRRMLEEKFQAIPASPHGITASPTHFQSGVQESNRPLVQLSTKKSCSVCSYSNSGNATVCEMCFGRHFHTSNAAERQEKPVREIASLSDDEDEDVAEVPADESENVDRAEESEIPALNRNLSSASMRCVEETALNAQADLLACTWSFEGGLLPENKRVNVELIKQETFSPEEKGSERENTNSNTSEEMSSAEEPSLLPKELRFLLVPNDEYLQFEHSFAGNGSEKAVYLNQYSLVLDVNIPKESMAEREFIALLQTNLKNDTLADWYVKGDGSVGCIEYSGPGTVKPDKWHRLVMTADLTAGEIHFFVDGVKSVSLHHDGEEQQVMILEDDRWAIDSCFHIFHDVDQKRDAPAVWIARLQLRSYAMSSREVSQLGRFNADASLALPDVFELADRLSADLQLPKVWCIQALHATQQQLPRARSWLRSHEQALIARTVAEARMLTALGYSRKRCAHAICITSSLSDAIHWLLENEDVGDSMLPTSRIMEECCKDDTDFFVNSSMLAINLADDDQDAHNRTYEIYDSTSATDDAADNEAQKPDENREQSDIQASVTRKNRDSSRLSLPPLGFGMRQVNAEIWETARQLFLSHARQSTVSILENSLIVNESVPEEDEVAGGVIGEMQEKLLAMDESGRSFLRNYLRAFPESIRKDIRSGTMSVEIDRGDPIQVLRRKLLQVFNEEISRASRKFKPKLDAILWPDALDIWAKSKSTKRLRSFEGMKKGTKVFWIESNFGSIHEGVIEEIEHQKSENEGDDEDNMNLSVAESSSGKNAGHSKLQKQEDFQQLARVLYDFEPQRKGDLCIREGETVVVMGATKSGWGRAKNLKSGNIGLIPLSYVDAIGGDEEELIRRHERQRLPSHSLRSSDPKDRSSNNSPTAKRDEKKPFLQASIAEKKAGNGSLVRRIFKDPSSLILEKPPSTMHDSRISQAIRAKHNDDLWKASVLRSLSEDVLHELILLARGPWQFLPGGLQAGPSVQFQEIWNDRFTSISEQVDPLTKKKKEVTNERGPGIRIWRPFADAGFSILGDVAVSGTSSAELDRPAPLTVVSDDDGMGGKTLSSTGESLLVPPIRFRLVWQNLDAENDEPVSLWQPVPPEGYVALGCVAVKGHQKREPDPNREGLQQLRCVHKSCVQVSTLQHGLWSFRPGDSKNTEEVSGTSVSAEASSGNPGTPVTATGGSSRTRRASSTVQHREEGSSRWSLTKTSPSNRAVGVSIWEIDNSSRTFVPVLAKDSMEKVILRDGMSSNTERHRERTKLLSMSRIDATTIESRLCMESHKKSNDEETKAKMLHGLNLITKGSTGSIGVPLPSSHYEEDSTGAEPDQPKKLEREDLRPFHLGLASTSNSNHGSSELLLWILQLFSEFDSNESSGMGVWAKRVFSPQLVHALLRFSRTATPSVRIKAIRMLAMVIRRTPADSLRGKLGRELLELRVQMESLYKRQAQKPKDGVMDEMPLFSSLLCALAEVFVSVSLTDRQKTGLVGPRKNKAKEIFVKDGHGESGEEEDEEAVQKHEHEYFDVTFEGLLGIEILSNNEILIVHSVKPNGAAAEKGVLAGDIFWNLNGERLSELNRDEMWKMIKTLRPLKVTFLRDKKVSKSAASRNGEQANSGFEGETRQGALVETNEEDVALDPLSSHENWFQQLSELAAIMEALVHREKVRMPSEFLMSEDTFLKLVLSHHTAVVESQHPYSNKLIKGQVTIPNADALMVRFDRRCSVNFGKTLSLSCSVRMPNSNEVKDLQVERLMGCFGGTSAHIPSHTMSYQFPLPHSMDWSFHKTSEFKAPEIRVTNNGLTASLRKDKIWQTVFTTTGFNSGINSWEVRVDRTGPSANIFFGVAMKSAKVSNYLGSDDKGWGWIGCMACWHGGRKVRHRFGKRLKAGDIVRVTLDIPRRCMSLAVNGEDWGVAFNKLPLPSTVLKPGNELVPTFSFYNKDDQITLLSGSSPMDAQDASILHQLRSNFEQQQATARLVSRLGQTEPGGGSSGSRRNSSFQSGSRRSSASSSRHLSRSQNSRRNSITRAGRRRNRFTRQDSSENLERSPSRRRIRRNATGSVHRRWSSSEGLVVGDLDNTTSSGRNDDSSQEGDGGGSIENDAGASQVEHTEDQALLLSALGYPVEWCEQALNATENDMNRAAEYLIANADRMAEESKQEAERAAVEAEEQVLAEEEEWLDQVNKMLDLDQQDLDEADGDVSGASATAAAAVAALQSAASNRIEQREYTISSTGIIDEDPSSKASSPREAAKKRNAAKEWGYRMTISPLFSREVTKKIAREPRNAQRLQVFHKMFESLTLAHDCELVQMVNEICAKQGEDPLTLSPNDLEPSSEEMIQHKLLEDIPLLHLQLRFLLLRNFNRRLAHILPLIDLSCATHESALAASLRSVRGLVMSSVKKALFERVLADSHSGDDHWMQQNKIPTVTLDRNKAASFLKSGRVDVKGTRTVFGQLFSQLHGSGVDEKSSERNPLLRQTEAVKNANLLRNSHRAWYTILAGERADDYGGPYRDVINQSCQELLSPALPLFIPCPNQIMNQGLNRGKWLPSASATNPLQLRMFEFVGKLMGIAMRTKNPFVLDLPSFVWKQLCSDSVSLAEIAEMDVDFSKSYQAISEIDDEDALRKLDLKFMIKGSDGKVSELIPGGSSTQVTLKRKQDYLRALLRARLHELDRQCLAIARGLATQVPRNLLSIFTSKELELMVCGPPEVDIDILKTNTIYGEGITENTPSINLFWQVLEEFSQEDRQKYLRFVWGRSRLPSSSQDWERKHKINKLSPRGATPADKLLPTAHTCFFSIDIPMYTSKQVCREKLLYAVTHCIAIDMDETTVARNAADISGDNRHDEDFDEEDD